MLDINRYVEFHRTSTQPFHSRTIRLKSRRSCHRWLNPKRRRWKHLKSTVLEEHITATFFRNPRKASSWNVVVALGFKRFLNAAKAKCSSLWCLGRAFHLDTPSLSDNSRSPCQWMRCAVSRAWTCLP